EALPAPIALCPPQLQRRLHRRAGLVDAAVGEVEVAAPREHHGPTLLVAGGLEARRALLEQVARASEVPLRPRDAGLVGEGVADGRLAGDLGERLQRVLEDHRERRAI